jgi:hypothetical protein
MLPVYIYYFLSRICPSYSIVIVIGTKFSRLSFDVLDISGYATA